LALENANYAATTFISLLAPALIDAIGLYLLSRKDVRSKFFEIKE
jgi:hypothetical protein